jgi:hypothetical protein
MGLLILAAGVLWRNGNTPLGLAVLGTIAVPMLLNVVAVIVLSNWFQFKHDQEMKAERRQQARRDRS